MQTDLCFGIKDIEFIIEKNYNINCRYTVSDKDSHRIMYVKGGKAELRFCHMSLIVEKGDIIVLYPHEEYTLKSCGTENWTFSAIAFCPSAVFPKFERVIKLQNPFKYESYFQRAFSIWQQRSAGYKLYISSLLYMIFYDLLKESEKTLSKTDPFTVYGALIKKSAVGEGFALAFKQLCDMADIDCIVVSGKRDGAPHMWNLVLNRGEWSHVDCSYDAGDDVLNYTVFGLTDEEMPSQYTWDRNAYPEAASHVLREMLSLPVDESVNGEGSVSMESTVDDETTIVAEEISSDEGGIVSDAGTED